MTPELGRLERVELRNAWANEATHFTPWLAQSENLALLGEAIGIDLELEAQEKSVGPFSADLLCKDKATDNWVLIENQLERTDHKHLGQLITYAAGLQAVTFVWIATPFVDEHRAALDWLNQITDNRFNFFGLEVELWRIGDSLPAPKFNVVSQPNDWSKAISESVRAVEASNLTEAKKLQLKFWTFFREFVISRETPIRPTKPLPQHWMNIFIGKGGFQLSAIASVWDSEAGSFESGEIRAEFYIHHQDAKHYFELLHQQKEEVETQIGYQLVWHNPEETQSCRIFVRKPVNLRDEGDWQNQFHWLLGRLEDLYAVFGPRIKNLSTVS
jgi:hypothetical protein